MAIKTITINAGDCVILPSDASIQSVVVDGSVSFSSESCAPLVATIQSKVESYSTYRVIFTGPVSDSGLSGDATQNWEPGNYFLVGLRVGGVDYNIYEQDMGAEDNGPYATVDMNFKISQWLKSALNPFAPLFSATVDCAVTEDSSGSGNDHRGWTVRCDFQTVPSIFNDMFFIVRTNVVSQFGDITSATAYLKPFIP